MKADSCVLIDRAGDARAVCDDDEVDVLHHVVHRDRCRESRLRRSLHLLSYQVGCLRSISVGYTSALEWHLQIDAYVGVCVDLRHLLRM